LHLFLFYLYKSKFEFLETNLPSESEDHVYKKSLRSLIIALPFILAVSLFAQGKAPKQEAVGPVSRLAELDNKIAEQKSMNASLLVKKKMIVADSAASDANADQKIASATQAAKDLSGAVAQGENTLKVLQQSITSFSATGAEKETGLKDAETRLHASVAKLDPEVIKKKQALEAAEKKLDKAQKDSSALSKKYEKEVSGLRDSLKALDLSMTHVKRQVDSITTQNSTMKNDSASAWKKNDEALTAASKLLHETRRAVAANDSLINLRTAELNSLRKDSSGALSSSVKNGRTSEQDAQRLDSLSRALQTEKITLYQMQEKIKQDSIILALTKDLNEMRKSGGASIDAMEEKQQMIQTFTTKRDNLMRDRALAAKIAVERKTSREALDAKINTRLAAIDRTLDSVTMAREKISRDNVFFEKEFNEKSKGFIKRIDTLSRAITRLSQEGINVKVHLPQQQKDSADAALRRDSANQAYAKKQGPFVQGLKKKTEELEVLKRERDALDKKIQNRDSVSKKDLAAAGAVVASALADKNKALAEYNDISAKQQKAREDSIGVTGSMKETVNQAQVSMEVKKEELTVKKGQQDQLIAQLKQAREDSAAAVRTKKTQQVSFQKMLAELQFKILEGEQALKELQNERAVLKEQSGGK